MKKIDTINQVEAKAPTLKLVEKADKPRAKLAAKMPTETHGHPVIWSGHVRYIVPAGSIVSAPNARNERTISVKLCGGLALVITTNEPIAEGKLAQKRELNGVLQIFRHKDQSASIQAVTLRELPCCEPTLALSVSPDELRLSGSAVYGVQLVRCHLKVSRIKQAEEAALAA